MNTMNTPTTKGSLKPAQLESENAKPPQYIEYFSDTKHKHPTHTGNINSNKRETDKRDDDILVDNHPFSRTLHLTVGETASEQPQYDLAVVTEPQGAVAIGINRDGQLAILRHFRPVVATRAGTTVYPTPDVTRHGAYVWEFARGFPKTGESHAETAVRETREEVGGRVGAALFLGWVNANTAFMLSDIPVYAVQVQRGMRGSTGDGFYGNDVDVDVDVDVDAHEVIQNVVWMDVDEFVGLVGNGGVRCGLTLAALTFLLARREEVLKFAAGANGDGATK